MIFKVLLLLLSCSALSAEIVSETELSILQSGGNTITETYNIKTESSLEKEKNTYTAGGHYTFGSSNVADGDTTGDEVVENARNWDVYAKYERNLTQRLSALLSIKVEGDEFAGYEKRENVDVGGKYKFETDESIKSFFEFGYRYTVEKTVTENDEGKDTFRDNKLRAYYEFRKKIREGFSYKLWVEYIYNLSRPEDYLINTEPSLSLAIDKTFSLKVAYKLMYDNLPAVEGNEQHDWQYTTSLIASY